MSDVDVQLRHEAAKRNHVVVQRVAAFRHAAMVLEQHLPVQRVQLETVRMLAKQLRVDAARMEAEVER